MQVYSFLLSFLFPLFFFFPFLSYSVVLYSGGFFTGMIYHLLITRPMKQQYYPTGTTIVEKRVFYCFSFSLHSYRLSHSFAVLSRDLWQWSKQALVIGGVVYGWFGLGWLEQHKARREYDRSNYLTITEETEKRLQELGVEGKTLNQAFKCSKEVALAKTGNK
jgi:hypothetical protein